MNPRSLVSAALFGVLTTTAPPAVAAGGSSLDDLRIELPRRERPRRVVRDLLGRNRLRRLNLTRYEMEFYHRLATPALDSNPGALAHAEDVLLSSFLRVSRGRLERYLRLEDRWDRVRGKKEDGDRAMAYDGGLGLRVSPRVYMVDGGTLVGAKLRLRGLHSELASRPSLGVTRELGGDNLRLRLSIDGEAWSFFALYHTDRRRHGESAEIGVSFTF